MKEEVNPPSPRRLRRDKEGKAQADEQIVCKYFIMNDLHNNRPSGGPHPVKVRQSGICTGIRSDLT